MVGRFESDTLTREALAHEDFCGRQGLVAKGFCLIGAAIVAVGIFTSLPSFGSLGRSSSSASASATLAAASSAGVGAASAASFGVGREQFGDGFDFSRWDASKGSSYGSFGSTGINPGFGDFGHDRRSMSKLYKEESNHLGLDFSLIALVVGVLACCILPPICNSMGTVPGPSYMAGQKQGLTWGQGLSGSSSSSSSSSSKPLLGSGSGEISGNPFAGNALNRGRMDVKPGELRGGGYSYGPSFPPAASLGGLGGLGAGLTTGQSSDWMQGGSTAAASGGSWNSPIPSPWSASSSSGLGQQGSFSNASFGALGNSISAWFGFGGGPSSAHTASVLPTDAEVTETYANFGVELQALTPTLARLVDKEVIEPLMRGLTQSDQEWMQVLAPRGWCLTDQAPRLAGPGIGSSVQEVSVYDRHLPRPWCEDSTAAAKWENRQKLESFLLHPAFDPSQRTYVLGRLEEWRSRGSVATAIRHEGRRPNDMMPTDAHILENLVVKMLDHTVDFSNCFLASGQSPPSKKHLGQPAVAFLRQVTNQELFPRPAPHYEVVSMQKVWKLRPGNQNILEALALLLHCLRKQSPRSYQCFPKAVRDAIEQAGTGVPSGAGGLMRGFSMS